MLDLKFDVVVVSSYSDIDCVLCNCEYLLQYLNPVNIVIICSNQCILENARKKHNQRIIFLDEDKIYPGLTLSTIKSLFNKLCSNTRRAGWYFQQFLKMAYAFKCNYSTYLLWDADTIPLNKQSFVTDENKLIFTIKTEYHKDYFETINKLFGYNKISDFSFIAEHMMIDAKIMHELIQTIEKNNHLSGVSFFEKILYAVSPSSLQKSGFSEFETYGTFVFHNYPSKYIAKTLRTGRHMKVLIGAHPSEDVLIWVSKSYDIISLENNDWVAPIMSKLANKQFIQRYCSVSWFYFPYVLLNRCIKLLKK